MPYGDQGLLINKALYFQTGGYKYIPIMEDIDLVIRLCRKTKMKRIGIWVRTSSRKYSKNNILTNAIKNAILRRNWKKGVDPKKLAEKYYSVKD